MSTQDSLGLVGSVIDDKYEVTSVAGIGGFGVVYKAMHLLFRRTVALKVFSSLADFDAVEQKRLVEGFLQEAKVLADLSEKTPSICQARDVGVIVRGERQVPYMVLEWLEGENLEVVLDREKAAGAPPRTLEEAVRLLEPVAEGLALAHRLHIAHRDIKPSNIFVIGDARGEPTVKLLDFGIAKVVSDAQKEHGFTRTTGTVTSFTPVYGAPEQFARSYGSTGPWTDVFALALVVVETILGREALAGETFADVGRTSTDESKRPSPSTLGLTVDPAVEQVFLKALAVKPADRYSDAGELWNALRESMGLEPARSVAPSSALGARFGRLPESRATPTPTPNASAGAASIPSSAGVLSQQANPPEPAAKQMPHVPVALSALAA
ncbi:MAG: serine/threonine-protein kinase, partial [Polyangiaceae bacterium]